MMAPYAIAHMKIGLKLSETGYKFKSDERVRVYLTNTLEPASDVQSRLVGIIPALAHESEAVNAVKRNVRFTVVVGNPPYAGHSSNNGPWIAGLVDDYYYVKGKPLGERTSKWLQDDYVKFLRFAQHLVSDAGGGIVGFITNHGYLDNPTFRGMRYALLSTFSAIRILDLHGNLKKKEKAPDGTKDENVFEIQPGVAISLMSYSPHRINAIAHSEIFGLREFKYRWLNDTSLSETSWCCYEPTAPFMILYPQNASLRDEYACFWKSTDIFPINGVGMTTARDHVVIDFERVPLLKRAKQFRDSRQSDVDLCSDMEIPLKLGWNISSARRLIQAETDLDQFIIPVTYRPLDDRLIFYHDSLVWRTVKAVMRHMLAGQNLALAVGRAGQVIDQGEWDLVYVTRSITEFNLYRRGGNNLAPLYIYGEDDLLSSQKKRSPNFAPRFLRELAQSLNLRQDAPNLLPSNLTPEGIFHYIYAILYSPIYRNRYAEFLKIDFPRIPLTSRLELFRALAKLGGELVALHLLESPTVNNFITSFTGKGDNTIPKKPTWKENAVWINLTQRFEGVPENVWNFHIGGYQVCEKWLKDRKGRTLSADDIAHYQRIVVALSETIRIMAEIDQVIDEHGGWPIK
jgi:predicted helicase